MKFKNFICILILNCLMLILIQKNADHLFESLHEIIDYDKSVGVKFKCFKNESKSEVIVKKYALMSTTLDDNTTFNIPLVIHAWRRLNIEPIVIIVMDDNKFKYNENSSSGQILKYLNYSNIQTLYIKADANFSIVTAQVIRLFIGIFPDHIIKDDDFVMTTDSDLAPLNPTYYNVSIDCLDTTITVWNAFCCGKFKHLNRKSLRMFPMGHIGMTKKNWRNAVELNETNFKLDGDSVLKWLLGIYGKDFKQAENKREPSWYADQRLVSYFIQKYAQTKKVALDLRPFTGERLARTTNEEEWNKKLDEHDLLTDAHLYQTQCELFIRLFEHLLLKFFNKEIGLVEFYKKLFFKYWNFKRNRLIETKKEINSRILFKIIKKITM